MIVKTKVDIRKRGNKSYDEDGEILLPFGTKVSVHNEDEGHYYVCTNQGLIQGFSKESFEPLSVVEEREFKLNRILNIKKDDVEDEDERFPYDWNNASVTVDWSGKYPCLCSGRWTIYINEMELVLPEGMYGSSMNTAGQYSSWHFDDNYCEEFDHYYDGLEYDEWIKENKWLQYSIECLAKFYSLEYCYSETLLRKIYDEINGEDFRSGSCGGCI